MLNQGFNYQERVGGDAGGCTVLDYLAARYKHSTRAQWQERIQGGRVLVDQAVTCAEAVLRAGKTLVWRRPPWTEPDAPCSFAILYCDAYLLAVAKPAGLSTLPAAGFVSHTLLSLVRRRIPEAVPLHRLGRGTSGLVLFGKTRAARRSVTAAWQVGRVVKVYRALVSGSPDWDERAVDTAIGPVPHSLLGTVHAASAEGKPACSRVRVLERRDDASLVQVTIQTGRPHQIRIHLAVAGHPLCGDPLYTSGGVPAEGSLALPGDLGYRLHAERLELAHPEDGSRVTIECMPPPVLRCAGEFGC